MLSLSGTGQVQRCELLVLVNYCIKLNPLNYKKKAFWCNVHLEVFQILTTV